MAEEAKAGIYDPNLLNGEKYTKLGEKALGQNTLFAAFPKVEDSIMWYTRAAETFRKSLLWEEAGDCYRRIAENEKLIGNTEEAGTSYVDCAHMYERVNWKTATVHYNYTAPEAKPVSARAPHRRTTPATLEPRLAKTREMHLAR